MAVRLKLDKLPRTNAVACSARRPIRPPYYMDENGSIKRAQGVSYTQVVIDKTSYHRSRRMGGPGSAPASSTQGSSDGPKLQCNKKLVDRYNCAMNLTREN